MIRIIIPLILLLTGLFHIVELLIYGKNKNDGQIYAKWSLIGLSFGFILVTISAITEFVIFPKDLNLYISIAGLVLVLIRIPLKYWAIKTLKDCWSPQIRIKDNHELIKEGPFKYIRHPAYFGALLELFGICLFTNSYNTMFTASMVLVILILTRIKLEEKVLIKEFGGRYHEYMKEVWPIFPFKKIIYEYMGIINK